MTINRNFAIFVLSDNKCNIHKNNTVEEEKYFAVMCAGRYKAAKAARNDEFYTRSTATCYGRNNKTA